MYLKAKVRCLVPSDGISFTLNTLVQNKDQLIEIYRLTAIYVMMLMFFLEISTCFFSIGEGVQRLFITVTQHLHFLE